MLIWVFLIKLSLALKVTEYRFGFNFGEIIYDYSGKGRSATNLYFKSTDRGLYLDGSLNSISMNSPAVPSTSSMIFWILPKSTSGSIVCFGNENEYLTQIRSDSSELRLDWSIKTSTMTSSGVKSAGSGSFTIGSWKLVLSTRKPTNCNIFGSCSILQYNLKTSSYTATGDLPNPSSSLTPYFFQIGAKSTFSSIQGFLWYFLITDTIESYSTYLTSLNLESCVLNSCLSCSEKFIDPTYGNICLSTSLSDTSNKKNSDCASTFGCSFSFIYECKCSTRSCGYNQNSNKFFCINTSTGIATSDTILTCLPPFVAKINSCCLNVCSECSSPKTCTSCNDLNAYVVPDNCQCKDGFFGIPSISSTPGCEMCGEGCSSCVSSSSCNACYDVNAQVAGGFCICKDGFIGTPAVSVGSTGCNLACVTGCGKCSGNICMSCVDQNAEVNSENICVCKIGYGGTPSSSPSISGCSYLCTSLCSSCDSSGNCLSCFDINSYKFGSTCKCNSEFLGTPASSESSLGCYSPCKSNCKECIDGDCLSCLDPLAELNQMNECVCKQETIGVPSSNLNIAGCYSCPSTRNQEFNKCGECKDENAELDANFNCICKTGYSGSPKIDSSGTGCYLTCPALCKDCLNKKCITCIDEFAEVNDLGECICGSEALGIPSNTPGVLGCVSCPSTRQRDKFQCGECKDKNSELDDRFKCICKEGYFGEPSVDSEDSGCVLKCDKSCSRCKDLLCISCVDENAEIVDNRCVCKKGFSFKSECIRNYFISYLEISKENFIFLIFSEPLDDFLTEKMIELEIDEKGAKYELIVKNFKNYTLKINENDIKEHSILKIIFQKPLVSKNNSLLKDKFISGNLHLTKEMKDKRNLKDKADKAKKIGRIGATTGVIIGLLMFFSIRDPSSLFDFVNTAEILYSVYLFDLTLNPIHSSFLVGVRLQESFPNFFPILIDTNEGVKTTDTLKDFGFETNLLLANIGPYLESLLGIIISGVILALFSLIPRFRVKLSSSLKNYKFSAFLRFWIQSFYEICTAMVFSIKFTRLENITQIIDFSFTIFFGTFEISGFFLMIWVLRRRYILKDDDEEKKNLLSKFGTFLEEFEERGLKDWIFYLIFIFRRLALVGCYCLVKLAAFQLSCSLFFSLLISLYFLIVWPHKQNIYNFYHILNELVISAYHIILLIGYSNGTLLNSEFKADLCIYLIYATWGLNFVSSLAVFIQKIVGKINNWLQERRLKLRENKYVNKTSPDMVFTYSKPAV